MVFVSLSIVTGGYLIITLKNRASSTGNTISLVVLLTFCLIITFLYGSDFIQLKRNNIKETSGVCQIEYIKGGKSIDTTEITIEGKMYTIKSEKYKSITDGTYSCKIQFLPITKTITDLVIFK